MDINKILEEHALWLESGGVKGKRAFLKGVDLRDRNLSGSNLSRCTLYRSDLRGSDLRGSDLREINLIDCDLRESNLVGCNLRESNLIGCNLRESNLINSILIGSDMNGSNLDGSDIRWSILPKSTIFIPRYHVTWWGDQLAIGCKQYTLGQWAGFSDKEIARMDHGALRWWRTWKDVIFQAVEASKGAYQ